MKKRIKVPVVFRAQLQQEIHSECPFCSEKQVETFEMHHMNGDPADNGETIIPLVTKLFDAFAKFVNGIPNRLSTFI
jgi:hypothetical protein